MRVSGKISAAIEVLEDFNTRRVPFKTAMADWGRSNRYAGAKDRAWISGLSLDILRRRNSMAAAMGGDAPRALVLGVLHLVWKMSLEEIANAAAEEPHGPGVLSGKELETLKTLRLDLDQLAPPHIAGDFPEWLTPHMARVFGEDAAAEAAALSHRADIDLRLNNLKAPPQKSLQALKTVKAKAVPMLKTAARIAAPDPSERAPAVTIIPAFNKGWVEVQDLGSQIAAAAAGDIKAKQVLDFCAGGGGKTLALAALMENTGQLFAWDIDARRLKPLYARAKRAGVRNLQIRSPAGGETLDDLEGKMDVVFLDAPCSGAGTWRRHPDTKWRLTEKQLERRMQEQDIVLREGARYVRPGGRMVYVTCSFLMEENEDRLEAFLGAHADFSLAPALPFIQQSGLVTQEDVETLQRCETTSRALRLTPHRLRAEGFFICVLQRRV